MVRFEVLGLASDRALIRALAKRLVDAVSGRIRAVNRTLSGEPPEKGGILDALRRLPLVGAGLDLERARDFGRAFDL